MSLKILIIDDDDLVGKALRKVLEKIGYTVNLCVDAGESNERIKSFEPDLILLDIYLTTHNGLELLRDFQKKYSGIPVIMITGFSDVKIAVEAMKSGAYDFLLKPIELEQLRVVIGKVEEVINLKAEVDKFHIIAKEDVITKEFFGKNRKIQKTINIVEKLSHSNDTTILIEGESGTGKEITAKFIHQNSPRRNHPFIEINCSAIPKELAESELFGHEKGAFTGAASKTKLGKFELADKGTLLLDEIGELSLELQAKLLRVLQEKRFYRVGGEKEIKVDVRILAATNKNLEDEVKKGNFREDLFYRLNVAKVTLPPLRERQEDIKYLAYSFLKEFSSKFSKNIRDIDEPALKILREYHWKGNIRELRNVMERAVLLAEEIELKERDFAFILNFKGEYDDNRFDLKIPPSGIKIDLVLKELILKTLHITGGNQVRAAKVLGLSRSKLRYRMEQLGIEVTKDVH